ncbi:MAG: hypothetical protein ACYDG6_06665 [Thermincolia bacterium]
MRGQTTITIMNPPGTDVYTFSAFKQCNVQIVSTGRVSSFNFAVEALDSSLIDRFPKGSDVKIWQGYIGRTKQTLRGWLNVPAKMLDGRVRVIEFAGVDYTGKFQNIVVTESYTSQYVHVIVQDLMTKYVPWATANKVQASTVQISKKFNREYLFEALEFLAGIIAWEFYVDNDLNLNFFDPATMINTTTLSQSAINYRRGTAKFTEDPRLINKLYVKGGNGLSTPFAETFIGDGVKRIFNLGYKPTNVTVKVNTVTRTLGIDNIDTGKDFYINYQEKFVKHDSGQPVYKSTDTVEVTYRYEYPILLLLEDKISQAKYGTFEDKLDVNSDDKDLVKLKGLQHLQKYSNPLKKGNIEPLEGFFRAGELVPIDIPNLNVKGNFKASQVTHSSTPGEYKQTLTLEDDYDTRFILKEIRNSIKRLQDQFEQDGPVEQIHRLIEILKLTDMVSIRLNNELVDNMTLSDTVGASTQNSGTFVVGTARVGFADVG